MTVDPFAEDKLNRRPDAELLSTLIANEPRPAVVSVDAPWGAGKTTFIRMWGGLLASRGHPVVHYNAWETDFVDDPLIAFIGELEQDLGQLTSVGPENSHLRKQWRRLRALGAGVIRSTGPLAMRIATQGILNVDDVRSALGFVADANAEISELIADVTEKRLETYQKEKAAVTAFRETLAHITRDLTSSGKSSAPLVVFVDELDRCRPSFAIALLERMKHLFAVDRVVFVLALDREQLAHTVRAVYGTGFAAEGYLRRFIDFDYRLPLPEGKAFAEYLAAKHSVIDVYKANTASSSEYDSLVPTFAELSKVFGLTLRDQEQSFQRIVLALKSADSPQHYLYTAVMVFFGVLRFGDPTVYHQYMSGRTGVQHLLDTVRNRPGGAKYLESRKGIACQAYLLLSARRDSDAQVILKKMTALRDDSSKPKEEREPAADLLDFVQHFRQTGGSFALRVALARLEKINQQIEVYDYD